jgi:hypothetical protein
VIDGGVDFSYAQEISWDDVGRPEEAVARGAALRVATILGRFKMCVVHVCMCVFVCVCVCARVCVRTRVCVRVWCG